MSNGMGIALGVAAVVVGVTIGVLLGFIASWTASDCYPWRRCGRCGQDKAWPWRRRAKHADQPSGE